MDSLFSSEDGLFEGQLDRSFDITAATGSTLLLLAAAKERAKDITEAAIAKIELKPLTVKALEAFKWISSSTAARSTADTGVTELIVSLTLLLVLEDFVSFIGFFELSLIAAFLVRVVLDGKLAKRLFYLIGRGVFAYPKNFVIISF
jgi:hypothetical protein